MVRRAKRPSGNERLVTQRVGDAVNFCGLQGLIERERWENGRQPFGQHGFARAGRTDHDDVMPARRGYLDGPLRVLLALHFLKVHFVARPLPEYRIQVDRCRCDRRPVVEMLDDLLERLRRIDGKFLDHSRLFGVFLRDIERADAGLSRFHGNREHPTHLSDHPIQSQLPEEYRPFDPIERNEPGPTKQTDGNGKIQRRPFLLNVRRSEIDRDFLERKRQTVVIQGGLNAVAALLNAGIRQTDNGKRGQAAGKIKLHLHNISIDPQSRTRKDLDIHLPPPCSETFSSLYRVLFR